MKRKILIFTMLGMALYACSPVEQTQSKDSLFKLLSSDQTGVNFINSLSENDSLNYFTYPYIYMGGGVSIGDINNDGLNDLFFTGNMVDNRLYLNKGNLEFEDITAKAGIKSDGRWNSGTTMADINDDGLLDIYICVSGLFAPRNNLLYINNGDLTFTESAASLNLNDGGNSVDATFFDYDNDNDLDVYIANYPMLSFNTPTPVYANLMAMKTYFKSDKLYRNDNGEFTDVTGESGIQNFGLGISVTAADLNNDGWQDLYVSNDFQSPDYLYFNNGDGTFSERTKEVTNHTSYFGMGADIADINNDGLLDLYQVDMTPEDNRRNKANMASMNPNDFYLMVETGMHHQYMQNALQLNHGNGPSGLPVFSDVARLTGTSNTDWSWAPLIVDFDNDGLKDLFVANGIRRDINNKDYFASIEPRPFTKRDTRTLLEKSLGIPSEPVNNYAYKNLGNTEFENVTDNWGLTLMGFSNGAAYGDLDNDGDLDLVISNIDDEASIFENRTNEKTSNSYLRVNLKGLKGNTNGLGSRLTVYYGKAAQTVEHTLSRGYQSSVETTVHFGTGAVTVVDSLKVVWPDGMTQVIEKVQTGQEISVEYVASKNEPSIERETKMMFTEVTEELGIDFVHEENDFDDYAFEPLLPHRTSMFGSGLAAGDVNGDDLDDFYVGGAYLQEGALYLQNSGGTFYKSNPKVFREDKIHEDMGAQFFDADGDGDLDLYVVSGGNEFENGSEKYQDRLYVNDGSGDFTKNTSALPKMVESGSRVKPFDFDADGDLDLFVGGRHVPRSYPLPAKSRILKNESSKGNVKFEDVTSEVAPELLELGMVTDAKWIDFDQDDDIDLVVSGEWMPLTFFENNRGYLTNVTADLGLDETVGWWFSVDGGDFDNDGDVDFIGGNLGLNYKYKASVEETFDVYVSDYDENGRLDIVLGYYNDGVQYPVRGRQCSSQQVPEIKKKFENYDKFSVATLEDVYTSEGLDQSLHYRARTFASSYFENKGGGQFEVKELPRMSQLSSLNSMVIDDFNADGNLDVLSAGNLFSSEVETPRNDGGVGVYLLGDGKGNFESVPMSQSGLCISQDAKELKSIRVGERKVILVVNNNSRLQAIEVN